MRRLFIKVVVTLGCVFIFSSSALGAWVESHHQGIYIRHPKGWKVDWREMSVNVGHPEDRMIWCLTQSTPFQGSARQLAEAVVKRAASQGGVSEVKLVQQKQVSQRPDIYGIKFSGQVDNVPFNCLVLTATEDGQNFVIRQFSSPTKQYDEMKLTLIPILCSLRSQAEANGKGESKSGGWQIIQSPHGIWRFMAPADWKSALVTDIRAESVGAAVIAPDNSTVVIEFDSAWTVNNAWVMETLGSNWALHPRYQQLSFLPYLPAAQVFERILFPSFKKNFRDAEMLELTAINQQQVKYCMKFSEPKRGISLIRDGMLINSSIPFPGRGDFNQTTDYKAITAEKDFQNRKDQLWQVLSSFEASPQWGSFYLQEWAKMARQNVQAMNNMALQNMRTNKQIMAQHVGIAQQKPGMMAQQGQGWIKAVTGQEVVSDQQSGQRWQVPVGGQYIYGRNTGEIIRAERPLQTHELPEGFRQFEAVK